MSAIDASVIICGACQRKFAWKPELAGKRVKCKCGEKIAVSSPAVATRSAPAAVPVQRAVTPVKKPKVIEPSDPADLDGLLALADDAERASAALPIEVMEFAPEPVVPIPTKAPRSNSAIPLGYKSGPTAREKQRAAELAAAHVDPVRDLYAPLATLAVGFVIHMTYFIIRYHLGGNAVVPVGIGVVILTVINASLLIGFALVAATPLGVSFGGLWSAVLKLSAMAVLTDGLICWIDMGVDRISGGTGGGSFFGLGMIGLPAAAGLFWAQLIYFFSMDPGDSWTVVVLLAVLYRIIRFVLTFLLLATFLSWGGVSIPVVGGTAAKAKTSVHASLLSTHVDDLKEADALVEAGKYIDDGHQAAALKQPVKDWYATGCPNVWFEMSNRDINGHRSAQGVIVELPQGKAQRAKCYDILKQYDKDAQIFSDPSDFQDTGEDYLEVQIR